jgi:pSer/pThr/pTyr-binding forkhead associated (FHA) protein
MVELRILSGKMAGVSWTARRFPVRVGRSAGADLQLEEPGVFDDHFQIRLHSESAFELAARPDAPVSVNAHPVQQKKLANGDTIGFGSVKIQFWLGAPRQRGLKISENLVWALLAAVCAGQVFLIAWLVR